MSSLRYTDKPPPRSVWEKVANWVHAYGEEGKPGQDETTIKPQRRQDRIDHDTRYTTADVWLPDGKITLGVLTLTAGAVSALEVHDGDVKWSAYYNRQRRIWHLETVPDSTGRETISEARLPLKYCSRLPYVRRRPIKGIVNADGTASDWIIEEY